MLNYPFERLRSVRLYLLFILLLAVSGIIGRPVYAQTFVDISPSFVGDSVQITGINSRGDFCGDMYNKTDFIHFPFVYLTVPTVGLDTGFHRITDIGPAGVANVRDISESGVLVGDYRIGSTALRHAAKWVGGVLTDLDNNATRQSNAYSISASGLISGDGSMDDPVDTTKTIAFVFSSNGGGLTVLTPPQDSCKNAVNFVSMSSGGDIVANHGIVFGSPGGCIEELVLWSGGGGTYASRPSGFKMYDYSNYSGLINSSLQIIGELKGSGGVTLSRGILQKGLYTPMQSLSTPGKNAPQCINDRGQIGGTEGVAEGSRTVPHGTLYLPADAFGFTAGLYDMNTIVPDVNLTGFSTRIKSVKRLLPNGLMLVEVGSKFNGQFLHHILKPASVGPFVELSDGAMFGGPIANATFTLEKVGNDPPVYTTTFIDTVFSDNNGLVDLAFYVSNNLLKKGDSVRFTRIVSREPSVKHPGLLADAYRLEVDNGSFDSVGVLSFDTLTLSATAQSINVGHATMIYNLLVSLEWDADIAYLDSLEQAFRSMTNYAYDVVDGQLRFDTIMIVDDKLYWEIADIQIYADNMVHPHVNAIDGIKRNNDPIEMPRMWFGSEDNSRNHTFFSVPLSLSDPFEHRTLFHEFGHYALSFYDEYNFPSNGARCSSHPIPDLTYGFMDYTYTAGDPYASEMSSAVAYADNTCRNNKQWYKNRFSCWDQFALNGGAINNMIVKFIKPSERMLPAGLDFFPGPNTNMNLDILDYDVGALVVFPNAPTLPNGTRTALVDVRVPITGDSLPDARVRTTRVSDLRTTIQGNTASNGKIYVLGVGSSDIVYAAGWTRFQKNGLSLAAGNRVWMSAQGIIGIGDTLGLTMATVNGSFPVIPHLVLADSSTSFSIDVVNPFLVAPRMSHSSGSGAPIDYISSPSGSGYTAIIDSSLFSSGLITVWTTDDSGVTFFFDTDYSMIHGIGSIGAELKSAEGGAEVFFDSSTVGAYRAVLLSSAYPVLRNGLDPLARQAGLTYSLDSYPGGIVGTTNMTISYSQSDLLNAKNTYGEEFSIRIHRWDDITQRWVVVGGTVDTVLNQVATPITETGVYAAFTTDIISDIDDGIGDANSLPYRFKLSQNYPNPFNPSTVIEYSIDHAVHVKIELFNILGQKIRTLVDRKEKAGTHAINWDGTDASGALVATGVYLYRFEAGDYVETKKMLLLK